MTIGRSLMTAGLGAGLMYLLDPREGRRRRAMLRDQVRRLGRVERDLLGKASRDLSNRAHGLAERVRHPTDTNVPDEVLAARESARAGHRRNATPRRLRWSPALRAAAIAGGGGLILSGLARGHGLGCTARMLAGGALVGRGMIDRPLGEGILVQKAITVEAPVELVFALWSELGNFPRFLQHVRRVEVAEGGLRSHWSVDGPFGAPIEFDAEMTRLIANQLVEWQTLPDQPIEHEGCVHFEPQGDATRVTVEMYYRPPGGAVGHALARLFGWDPRARMNDDLVRMKGLLEEGHTRAHGQRVDVADVIPPPF
jgi:uncharacterized membrane protein